MNSHRATAAATLAALVVLIAPPQRLAAAERDYETVFEARLDPAARGAHATVTVGKGASALRELRFRIEEGVHSKFSGDGEVRVSDEHVTWEPPETGGSLRYFVRLEHKRRDGGYDALITDRWALFRGDDLFPPAAVRTLKGARSVSRLIVTAPEGWEVVTPYGSADDGSFPFERPGRGFDRPVGWIIAGHLGIRRAKVADTRIAIAAPEGHGLRRMDIMAFLRWTLPALREIFPKMADRLVIFGADDPMWRGGLSGPGSFYMHADRPLISENGTSTLLHELVHVAMGPRGSGNDDWVVEGLAEYYSVEILWRTGTLGPRRNELTLEALAEWGAEAEDLFRRTADGPIKARAVGVFVELAAELARRSEGKCSLDRVARELAYSGEPLTYRALRAEAEGCVGGKVTALDPERLPGAPKD